VASQLSLRITSSLDKSGFEAAKRESQSLIQNIEATTRSAEGLRDTFLNLGKVVAGAFAVSGFKNFVVAALETERTSAIIIGRLRTLGDTSLTSSREVEALAAALARTGQFTQTELLQGLSTALRTVRSASEAFEVLSVSQKVAIATGRDLSSAVFAITRAQQGLSRPLQLLTGLTAAQIKQFREEDNLLPQLTKRFEDAATAVDQTFSGALRRLNSRFAEVGETLGRIVLPIVQTFVSLIEKVPTPLLTGTIAAGGATIAIKGLVTAFTQLNVAMAATTANGRGAAASIATVSASATVSATRLAALATALRLVGAAATGIALGVVFAGFSKFIADTEKINEEAAKLNQRFAGIVPFIRGNDEAFGSLNDKLDAGKRALKEYTDELKRLQDSQAKGVDVDKKRIEGIARQRDEIRRQVREVEAQVEFQQEVERFGTKEQEKRFLELTQTKDRIRQLELVKEIASLEAQLVAAEAFGEDRKVLELKLANDRIELEKLTLSQLQAANEKFFTAQAAQTELFIQALRAQSARTRAETGIAPEDASRELTRLQKVRDRQIDDAERIRKAKVAAIDEELQQTFISEERRKELQRDRLKAVAEENAAKIKAQEELIEKEAEFPEIPSRPDLGERAKKRLESLGFDQGRIIKELTKLDQQIEKKVEIPVQLKPELILTPELFEEFFLSLSEQAQNRIAGQFTITVTPTRQPITEAAPAGEETQQ